MTQMDLNFDSLVVDRAITGDDFDPVRDLERLRTQLGRIYLLCRDGEWRTVRAISLRLGEIYQTYFPENSVQAQLRNLRKFGVTVKRRRVGNALSEYRVVKNPEEESEGSNGGTEKRSGANQSNEHQ